MLVLQALIYFSETHGKIGRFILDRKIELDEID